MKAFVEIPQFKDALTTTKAGIATARSLPVLSGARIEVGDGRMTVTTSDLDLTVRVALDALVDTAGVTVIPHKLLTSLVHGKGSFGLDTETAAADEIIATNGSVSTIRTLPTGEYPRLRDDAAFVQAYPVDVDRLRLVLPGASNEDSRPILTGVAFLGEEIVTTDSYRLHISRRLGVDYPHVLVPSRALAAIVGAVKGRPDAVVTMHLTDEERRMDAQFRCGDTVWTTRLIEGEFPNYKGLLPMTPYPNLLTFDRDDMIAAVRQAKTMVHDTTTPVRLHLDPKKKTIELAVISHDVGSIKVEAPADYAGVELNVAFNPEYLLDTLLVGDRSIEMRVMDALKPAVITDASEPGNMRLLMPVRVP